MTYELTIERRQPTCGGRAPTKCEIKTVTTDDPVAYVQALEKDCELEVTNEDDAIVTAGVPIIISGCISVPLKVW